MINVEQELIRFYSEIFPNVPVFGDVPACRPSIFITIERTGGSMDRFIDSAQVAVQVWAGSRVEASELASKARYAAGQLYMKPWVTCLQQGSLYSFPDPDSRQARYQFTLGLGMIVN